MAETLAEIIAEGERLEEAFCCAPSKTEARSDLNDFYHEHGPALLAVAKAAVEMRIAQMRCTADHVPDSDIDKFILACERFDRLAFDAAVRGEGKEKATGPCATGHDWIRRGEGSAGNKYVCLRCGEQKP